MLLEFLVALASTLGSLASLALLASGHVLEAAVAVPSIVCLIVILATVAPGLGRRGPGTG